MQEDYTEIVVVLDRSGSMQVAQKDHEGGLNSFVKDQQTLPGNVRFTLIQFDSNNPCEVVYDGRPIAEVGHCPLQPRGMTPLLDAIGKAVAHVAARTDVAVPKPDQVVCLIITDGQENASVEFTREAIKALIDSREQVQWRFLFLGANMDAFAEAGALGVSQAATMNFANTQAGAKGLYASASGSMLRSRAAVQRGASREAVRAAGNFRDDEREAALGRAPSVTSTGDGAKNTTLTTPAPASIPTRDPVRVAGDWSRLEK